MSHAPKEGWFFWCEWKFENHKILLFQCYKLWGSWTYQRECKAISIRSWAILICTKARFYVLGLPFWFNVIMQEALNTCRGRLQHFLKLLNRKINQKMIPIWFVHLLKSNKFSEFHRCGSKNVPATPIFILNFPRAWQSF